ncbi:MAG: hypothetical protein IKT40_05890 [Bacilli bacterium]|nr:hypothetical protein [Bacilli bacterium]
MVRLDYMVGGQRVFDRFKKKEKFLHWLNFFNLRKEDKEYLVKNCDALMKKDGSLGISTQSPNNPNDVKTQHIIKAYDYLTQVGIYEMPPLCDMLFELKHAITDAVSTKDMQNAEKANDEMWLQFMKELEKPETQLLLKSFGQFSLANSTFGWKLSQDNIFRARSQKPNVTFLQTRQQWRQRYGRDVRPGAEKITLLIPLISNRGGQSSDDLKKTMTQVGYKDNVKFGDLSHQQKDHVEITSRGGDAATYRYIAYYDVSDTVLIDPNGEDIWANEVGFEDNLVGKLNQAALDYKAKNSDGTSSAEDIKKIYNNEEGDIKLLTNALAQGISNNYPQIPTMLPKSDNVNAYTKCYTDMIRNLADLLIEEDSKIVREENRSMGVQIAVTFVLCLTRVSPEQVANKLANNELTDQSYFELRNIINTIINLINRNMPKLESKKHLNEMGYKTLSSVDEMLAMMGMSKKDVKPTYSQEDETFMECENKEKESIKESFYNLFNRMNKVQLY